jgi:STE24 endopeptidase
MESNSFSRLRQYPLYSKTAPPAAIAQHIKQDEFEKSQKYGKDKAKLGLFSKLYNQILDSAYIQFGFYPWCWKVAGIVLSRFGYGEEYEVRGK